MFVLTFSQVLFLFLFSKVLNAASENEEFNPVITIYPLNTIGFKAYIEEPHTEEFESLERLIFHANINKPLPTVPFIEDQDIVTTVFKSTDEKWVYVNNEQQLKIGDVIHYLVEFLFATADVPNNVKSRLSHNTRKSMKRNFTVTTFKEDLEDVCPIKKCRSTATKVYYGRACAGETIFDDHFDTLKDDVWQVEHYLPVDHPEHPFVSYQRRLITSTAADPDQILLSNATVAITNGKLYVMPKLQQNLPGYSSDSITSGKLDFRGPCTGIGDECYLQAFGASILPPIASGRLTSRGFAFRYGTVHIRAKLPQGDWLYPELSLEPVMTKCGSNHFGATLKIALSRGNIELSYGGGNYGLGIGNTFLYGGAILDYRCWDSSLAKRGGERWGDEFHVYSIKWEPKSITLSVDGQKWARLDLTQETLLERFNTQCAMQEPIFATDYELTPFDGFYYVSLGVAAGGVVIFDDGLVSNGTYRKPWSNGERKASLNFWQNLSSWYPTWYRPRLTVDYVKVVAL